MILLLNPLEIIFTSDFSHLPKSLLEDIADEINTPYDNAIELAIKIHELCSNNKNLWDIVYKIVSPYIFAGKCSIGWYPIVKIDSKISLLQTICDNISFNPIDKKNHLFESNIDELEISSTPQIIGGIKLDEEESYLLRLIFKSGTRRKLIGLEPSNESIISLVTLIINEEKNFIEIRGNDKTIKKVEKYIGSIFSGLIEPLERQNIIAPFGQKIGKLADSLGGKLVETISTPEEILSELNDEQSKAVVDILITIDEFFSTGDFTRVEETLRDSRACFENEDKEYLSIPFTAIILAGMNRLGMSSEDELRGQPLYNAVQPYLQHRGGFVKFPIDDNGVLNYYTIKVGIRTNTVYFGLQQTRK